jgi:hypothetical protein
MTVFVAPDEKPGWADCPREDMIDLISRDNRTYVFFGLEALLILLI